MLFIPLFYALFSLFSMVYCHNFPEKLPVWVTPKKPVPTIYFQGLFASQVQCSKYTGNRALLTTTGQHAYCPHALDIILTPYIGKELDEVILHDRANKLSVTSALTSPIASLQKLVTYAQEKLWGTIDARDYNFAVSTPLPSNRFDIRAHSIDVSRMNLGQAGDIREHKQKYDLVSSEYPDHDCILFGVSRGAAATFTALATHKYPNVKLVVLEGCYDSLDHLMQVTYQSPVLRAWVQTVFTTVTQYIPHGISPISCVNEFPEGTPAVFVHSKKDSRVPYECSYALATALAARKKNPVYVITLNASTHSRYHSDNQADAQTYLHAMHAIYQAYDLPHIPEYAQRGQTLLASCRIDTYIVTE